MISAADNPAPRRRSHSLEWLFYALCALLLPALLGACSEQREQVRLQGATMGTIWHVSYLANGDEPLPEAVFDAIDRSLQAVERSMSTYRDDSEISRVNRAPVGEPVPVSAPFAAVLSAALDVGERSGGAFDVTVMPLVELWGFGPDGPVNQPPDVAAIESALSVVGQNKLSLDEGERLTKAAAVALDFSSLAKGYGVDQVAAAMDALGIRDYLVEVGGEMRLSGASSRGDPWRIAIEQPESRERTVAAAMSITDRAIATSGDYRNYFEADGKRYSHTLDPRTGYPVQHDLVSVTVVHESAMLADAWATAMVVMGAERAAERADELGMAVYFIRRIGEDFVHSHSAAFSVYLEGNDA